MFHCAAIFGGLFTGIIYGVKIIFYTNEFNAKKIVMLMEAQKISVCIGTPTNFYYLAKKIEKSRNISLSVRILFIAGEELNKNTYLIIKDNFKDIIFLYFYGMTEVCSGITYKYLNNMYQENCVGKPYPSLELKIVDSTGVEVCQDEIGELCIRGKSLFDGYYNDKKEQITF